MSLTHFSRDPGFRFPAGWLSLALLLPAAAPVQGEKIFRPPYNDCEHWTAGIPGGADGHAVCNRSLGYLGVRASALVGAATAEATQWVLLPIAPEPGPRQIRIKAEIYRTGGVADFGFGEFSGSEWVLRVDHWSDLRRGNVEEWINTRIGFEKVSALVGLYPVEYGVKIIDDTLDGLDYFETATEFAQAFDALTPGEDYRIVAIDEIHTLPAYASVVPIWIGLRATAAAAGTGMSSAVSAGYVRQITVWYVDPPPTPVALGGGADQVALGQLLDLRLACYNPDDVSFWVDWDDGTPQEWTAYYPGNATATLSHRYQSTGQYLIKFKAKERDETTSGYGSLHVRVVHNPLDPPSIVASQGESCTGIAIRWTPNPEAASYRLYRTYHTNDTSGLLAETTATNYFHATTHDPVHYFAVRACRADQSPSECAANSMSAFAAGWVIRPTIPPPNFQATDWDGRPCAVALSWNPVVKTVEDTSIGTALGYYIYRSPNSFRWLDPVPPFTNAICLGTNSGPFNTNFFDIPPFRGETNYYAYWVEAYNECGRSLAAPGKARLRPAPQPLTGVTASRGEYCDCVQIEWDDPPDNYWTNHVLRNGVPISGQVGERYCDTNALPGVIYDYAVEACDVWGGCGCARSESVQGYVGRPPPPSNVRASTESQTGQVTVRWAPVTWATGYTIHKNTSNDYSTASQVCSSCSTTSFVDTRVNCEATYYYWVSAWRDSACRSAPSGFASGSANCAPVVESVSLQTKLQTSPRVDSLVVTHIGSDADSNTIASVLNWMVNDTEIAAVILPFETESDTMTRDYTGHGNHGVIHGARWVGREKLVHPCESLQGWQSLEGMRELDAVDRRQGLAALRWETTHLTNLIDLELKLPETQDWSLYDALQLWIKPSAQQRFEFNAYNPAGWKPSGWVSTPVFPGWSPQSLPISSLHSDVVRTVDRLLLRYRATNTSLTLRVDDLRLVRNGGPGGAYAFDGVDDYIEVPDHNSLDQTDQITVEAWVYPVDPQVEEGMIASKYVGREGQRSWTLSMHPDRLVSAQIYNPAGYSEGVTSHISLTNRSWNHVVFTFNGSTLALYVNGILSAGLGTPLLTALAQTEAPLRLGDNPEAGDGRKPFHGLIGDFRVYNRPLSSAQISLRRADMAKAGGQADSPTLLAPELGAGGDWSVQVVPSDGVADGMVNTTAVVRLLPTPTGLHATTNLTVIRLVWNPVPGATGYSIWRATANNLGAATLVSTDLTSNQYDDASTLCPRPYYYWVAASGPGSSYSVRSPSARGWARCAPQIHSISLASTNGTTYSHEDLRASVVATDAEGDPISFIYSWVLESNDLALLILPFEIDLPGLIRDYSIHRHTGAIHGATWQAATGTGPGAAYQFNGFSDFIDIPDQPTLALSNQFTVEVWLRPDWDWSADGFIAGQYVTAPDVQQSWVLWGHDATRGVEAVVHDSAGNVHQLVSPASLAPDVWNHVVLTGDGQRLRLYLNNSVHHPLPSEETITENLADTSAPLRIGGNTNLDSASYFKGLIGDFRLYRWPMSAEQISRRWEDMSAGLADSDTLVGQETTSGQHWSVRITPTDGTVEGPEQSSPTLKILGSEPSFVQEPLSLGVPLGASAVFSVQTEGILPISYEWRKDGLPLSSELRQSHIAFFLIPNVSWGDTGQYSVLLTNRASLPGSFVESGNATLSVLPDADNDLIPDDWETQYGFSPQNPADANLDLDADGLTNLQEYHAGTDPTDGGSRLHLCLERGMASNEVRLRFTSQPRHTYTVEWTADPIAPQWERLLDYVARAETNSVEFVDTVQLPHSRFYRLRTPCKPSP